MSSLDKLGRPKDGRDVYRLAMKLSLFPQIVTLGGAWNYHRCFKPCPVFLSVCHWAPGLWASFWQCSCSLLPLRALEVIVAKVAFVSVPREEDVLGRAMQRLRVHNYLYIYI